METSKIIWKFYHLIKNPDRIYQEGKDDALKGRPRKQFKMSIIFSELKQLKINYDEGYNDGLHEKLLKRY